MEVPYVLFEVRKGKRLRKTFAIDAYFIEFLSLEPRKVVLIKDSSVVSLKEGAQNPLPRLLNKSVDRLLKNLYEELLRTSSEIRGERVGHMRRWNIWRILGIPTGHGRHIAIDEELAKVEREYSLGLALLEKILDARGGKLENLEIIEKGTFYRELWLADGSILGREGADRLYTTLFKIDPVFRTAFVSAFFSEIGVDKALKDVIRKKFGG